MQVFVTDAATPVGQVTVTAQENGETVSSTVVDVQDVAQAIEDAKQGK